MCVLIWSVHLVEQVYPSLLCLLGVEVCKLYCCLCVIALITVGSDETTFWANSNANTRACIQLTVADDDIYGTSPVPVYTVVLSISSPTSRVTVGTNSQTTITVNDDDSETNVNLRYWYYNLHRCCCLHGHCYHDNYRG